ANSASSREFRASSPSAHAVRCAPDPRAPSFCQGSGTAQGRTEARGVWWCWCWWWWWWVVTVDAPINGLRVTAAYSTSLWQTHAFQNAHICSVCRAFILLLYSRRSDHQSRTTAVHVGTNPSVSKHTHLLRVWC
ncbi:unnamed protein product, partial [Pylaiella littoralis]